MIFLFYLYISLLVDAYNRPLHRAMNMKGGFGSGSSSKGFGSTSNSKPLKDQGTNYFLNKTPSVSTMSAPAHIPTINLSYPKMRAVYGDPPVFEIDQVFSKELCDDYINRAEKLGVKIASQTFNGASGSKRTSTTWYLPYKEVPELLSFASSLTGLPVTHFEEPQIVRYELGQQFTWHYDAIPPSLNKNGGNRLATIIVYLNSVPSSSGGATSFKDLNIQVTPEAGKALLFFPCYADGSPDDRTMHCGQICSDTKWIAQLWVHEAEYTSVTVPRE